MRELTFRGFLTQYVRQLSEQETNSLYTERNKIMRIIASAFVYMSECKASFHCEEYGFAKHVHFQDKQNRYGMIS